MLPFLVCRGSSNRNRHVAEMREPFRSGTGGAAQVLSGNGDPGDRAQR
jgi:hypothetical protein